jgi:hypothetical protein
MIARHQGRDARMHDLKTRRGFLRTIAVAAGAVTLAACTSGRGSHTGAVEASRGAQAGRAG